MDVPRAFAEPEPLPGDVLHDLELSQYLDVIVLSEEEKFEKPSKQIWEAACRRAGVALSHNVLHVGDELEA